MALLAILSLLNVKSKNIKEKHTTTHKSYLQFPSLIQLYTCGVKKLFI